MQKKPIILISTLELTRDKKKFKYLKNEKN